MLVFVDAGFCGGRKTGEPGEKPSEQGENQQRAQHTYGTEPKSSPGHSVLINLVFWFVVLFSIVNDCMP